MMTTITKPQAVALATFVRLLRPDWDQPGIVHAIGRTTGTLSEVAVALIRLAENMQAKTPALLPEPGKHWTRAALGDTPAGPNLRHRDMCPEHPSTIRTDCQRHEQPPPPEQVRAYVEQIKAGLPHTRPDRRPGVPT
jgi:hypothetical protein